MKEIEMKKLLSGVLVSVCAAAGLVTAGVGAASAADGLVLDRNAAQKFVTLPAGVRFPEGITANPANGDLYVATFDFGATNKLLRYDRHGRLLASIDFGSPMLGLAFGPDDGKVYITNFYESRIQRVAADLSGAIEDVAPSGARDRRAGPPSREEQPRRQRRHDHLRL